MRIRFNKKRQKRIEKQFSLGKLDINIVAGISKITGNLFFNGKANGSVIVGFANRGPRGKLGGYLLECDEVSNRQSLAVVTRIAEECRFNGLRPMSRKRGK